MALAGPRDRQANPLRQFDLAGLGTTGKRFIVDVADGKSPVPHQKAPDLIDLSGF